MSWVSDPVRAGMDFLFANLNQKLQTKKKVCTVYMRLLYGMGPVLEV
jgi:hypothetical protein